jgi:hypothetical protein
MPACRNSHDDIAQRDAALFEFEGPGFEIILRVLDRMAKRAIAARDDALNDSRRESVGRRYLRGIEHTETSARPRSHVEPPPATRERTGQTFHGLRHLREDIEHSGMRNAILSMDQAQHFFRTHLIQRPGAFESRFGRTSFGHLVVVSALELATEEDYAALRPFSL